MGPVNTVGIVWIIWVTETYAGRIITKDNFLRQLMERSGGRKIGFWDIEDFWGGLVQSGKLIYIGDGEYMISMLPQVSEEKTKNK